MQSDFYYCQDINIRCKSFLREKSYIIMCHAASASLKISRANFYRRYTSSILKYYSLHFIIRHRVFEKTRVPLTKYLA